MLLCFAVTRTRPRNGERVVLFPGVKVDIQRRRWRLAWLTALAALVSCASPDEKPSTASADQSPRIERCLRVSDIENWRVVDSRQLVVYGRRAEDAWHVRLFASCMDLNVSETVAFRARGTTLLCGDPGDEIITRGGRCPISSMRRIGPAEIAELLDKRVHKDLGKLPPREQAAPPPTQPEKK